MRHVTGDQRLLKRINRVALIRHVKAEPGLSRAELAERTGLTKTAVGGLAQELIVEGWFREGEPSASAAAGRRRRPLTLDPSQIGLLGAEIAVDQISAVACSLRGDILFSRRVPFHHRGVARTVRSLAGLVAKACRALAAQRRRTLGLGVAVPGMIDARSGALRFAPNIGWHDVPIGAAIADGLAAAGCRGLEVEVLNDARAAALGELVFGAEEPQGGPLVFINMGVGLGAGIVQSGGPFVGHEGLAGEIGHTILERGGPPCACGRRGCAESFISQRALSRMATGRDQPVLSMEELMARFARGDRATRRAVRQAGESMGVLLQNVANTLDPAVIVLGGSLCRLGDGFLETALASMEAHAGRHDRRRPVIRPSRFGLDACAVGAAASVFHRTLHPLEPGGRRR